MRYPQLPRAAPDDLVETVSRNPRALLQGGELTLLDESYAALDPDNLRQALTCARERAKAASSWRIFERRPEADPRSGRTGQLPGRDPVDEALLSRRHRSQTGGEPRLALPDISVQKVSSRDGIR